MRTHYVDQFKKKDGRENSPWSKFQENKWTFILVIIISSIQTESKWQLLLHSCRNSHWWKKIRCEQALWESSFSPVRCNQNRGLKTKASAPSPPSVRGLLTSPSLPDPNPGHQEEKEESDLQEQKNSKPNNNSKPECYLPVCTPWDQWSPCNIGFPTPKE